MTALERASTIVGPLFTHPHVVRQHAPQKCVRTPIPAPQVSPPKMRNKPAFHSAAGVRAAATATPRPDNSLTSYLAPIEIP